MIFDFFQLNLLFEVNIFCTSIFIDTLKIFDTFPLFLFKSAF